MKKFQYMMFIFLLWVRPIIQFVGRITSPTLIVFGFLLLIDTDKDKLDNWIPPFMIFSGFLVFILLDRYDKLLSYLNLDSDRDLIF